MSNRGTGTVKCDWLLLIKVSPTSRHECKFSRTAPLSSWTSRPSGKNSFNPFESITRSLARKFSSYTHRSDSLGEGMWLRATHDGVVPPPLSASQDNFSPDADWLAAVLGHVTFLPPPRPKVSAPLTNLQSSFLAPDQT